jgi:hypothetical protein
MLNGLAVSAFARAVSVNPSRSAATEGVQKVFFGQTSANVT